MVFRHWTIGSGGWWLQREGIQIRWACDCPGLLPGSSFQVEPKQSLGVSLHRKREIRILGSYTKTEDRLLEICRKSPWVWLSTDLYMWSRNYLKLEKEPLERSRQKNYWKYTGVRIVHVPKPARLEKPCNTQDTEKRPQKCVPLVMGPN